MLGGIRHSPEQLRKAVRSAHPPCQASPYLASQIKELKSLLDDPSAPFGVDLLLPQVGGNARKTNYDYNKGKLSELIDVIVQEKVTLFVSAVGVPPRAVVDRLHQAGVLVMNVSCDRQAD